jgi:hypothetical protein
LLDAVIERGQKRHETPLHVPGHKVRAGWSGGSPLDPVKISSHQHA